MKKNIKPKSLNFWNFCYKYCDIELNESLIRLSDDILKSKNPIFTFDSFRRSGITTLAQCLAVYFSHNNPNSNILMIFGHEQESQISAKSLSRISNEAEMVHYNLNGFYFENGSKIMLSNSHILNNPSRMMGLDNLYIITDNLNTNNLDHLRSTRFIRMVNLSSSSFNKKLDDSKHVWHGTTNIPWMFSKKNTP